MKTKEEKIKFLAELDGYKYDGFFYVKDYIHHNIRLIFDDLPHYLYQYDKIIPLIQKQPRHILTRMALSMKDQNDVSRIVDWLMFSPEQLADILIKVIENENKN